jgi:hypothetical protein
MIDIAWQSGKLYKESEDFGLIIAISVHTAKLHKEKIECGLYEYEAKDIENLEIYLSAREYYKCAVCGKRFGNVLTLRDTS